MISNDISEQILNSIIPVDVVLMDKETYLKMCSEVADAVGMDYLHRLFLTIMLPDSIMLEDVEIRISDKVKGYTFI